MSGVHATLVAVPTHRFPSRGRSRAERSRMTVSRWARLGLEAQPHVSLVVVRPQAV